MRHYNTLKLIVFCWLAVSTIGFGQEKNIDLSTKKNIHFSLTNFIQKKQQFNDVKFRDQYFVQLSFTELPNKVQLKQLNDLGIELLSYKNNNNFTAAIPATIDKEDLTNLPLKSIRKIPLHKKISKSLLDRNFPDWAIPEKGLLDIAIIFHNNITGNDIQNFLSKKNIQVLNKKLKGGTIIIARITPKQIENIATSPIVAYLDVVTPIDEKLNHENRITQRVNTLNNTVAGLGLTGKNVCAGVGDGGQLGDHIDFDNRIINKANGHYSAYGSHGDRVTGIIGSAGNLNPRNQGIAPDCQIITQKTAGIINNAENYFEEYHMVLTNNSYGVNSLCKKEGSYNYKSINLDWQMREFENMLHVFAAGNGGTTTCGDAPQGFFTVLPYSQIAKNVLTVGSVNEERVLAFNSSQGPSFDGRIKPEICGVGVNVTSTDRNFNYSTGSGTSYSSPSVVGTLALFYEYYRRIHNNEDPEGALIKAVACNTADDLGNPGPDFSYGYGLINARRAVKLLENEQHLKAELSTGENNIHTIDIPANVSQVKLMLYWHDVESTTEAKKSLVNDLDLKLTDPNAIEWLPWILDPTPANVANNATRGIDTLNNIEQITIDNPIAGSYDINVFGTSVPTGPQSYYIVYEFIFEELELTYPYGGESIQPNTQELIQWDVEPSNTSTFSLAYSTNNIDWINIDNNIPASKRSYLWTTPNINNTNVFIRITKEQTGATDSNPAFSILPQAEGLTIENICEGYGQLKWKNANLGAETLYEILYLDQSEMKMLGTTTDTSFVLDNANQMGEKYWYGVRAQVTNDVFTQRSLASSFVPAVATTCPWENDIKLTAVSTDRLIGRAHTSSSLSNQAINFEIKNIGNNTISDISAAVKISGIGQVADHVITDIDSGDTYQHSFQQVDFSAPGIYNVDTWVSNASDTRNKNDSIIGSLQLIQLENEPVNFPFKEEFLFNGNNNCIGEKIGIDGLQKWDFVSNSGGCVFYDDETTIVLSPPDEEDLLAEDALVLNLNLSEYNTSNPLNLSMMIYNDNQLGECKLWARGDDLSEWIEIYNIDPTSNNSWDTLTNINLLNNVLTNGQNPTASFQLKISRKGLGYLFIDEISIEEAISLPIELSYFKAVRLRTDVRLEWETLSEVNNDYFEIEWTDNRKDAATGNFEVIGKINGQGTTSEITKYQFRDNRPGKYGTQYYRLKQVDYDGSFKYSSIDSVEYDPPRNRVKIFPNPFREELTLDISKTYPSKTTIKIINSLGELIATQKADLITGYNHIDLNHFAKNLAPAVYFIELDDGENVDFYKLVKR